jgi:light-regulated signal transduction histidine kinase (bacteriophytochrome)
MIREKVNLSEMAESIAASLRETEPDRQVTFVIEPNILADGDPRLLQIVLENLLGNAWKFTSHHPKATIEFNKTLENNTPVYFVKDDGAGFDMQYAGKLFSPFQRMHKTEEFSGTGVGLATVQRIIYRHGGKVWALGEVEKGATVSFTLGENTEKISSEK